MELVDTAYKIRCELGACKNMAAKTIKFKRVGIRSCVHVCESCLKELYACIGATLIPPSIETSKKKEGKAK